MNKIRAALSLAALLCATAFADTTYTVESAVESALRENISVKRGDLDLKALERKAGKSWNGVLPSLSVGAGASKSNESSDISGYGSFSASVALSPAILLAVEQARLNYESGAITRDTALRDVELSVRKAFFSILYEKEYVAHLRKTLETAEKQYNQTLANQRAGLVSDLDVLTAQVSLENQRPTLATAEQTLLNDTDSFKQLIGVSQSESITLAGVLEESLPVSAIDIAGITPEYPTVTALEKSLDVARAAKKAALVGVWSPTFSLSYSYRPTFGITKKTDTVDAGSATAAVSLPLDGLIPWSSDNETVLTADDSVKDLELQLLQARTSASMKVSSLLRDIDQSFTTMKARRLNVSLAEKSYAMTEDAYRRGSKDLLSLQSASDSLQEAKVALMKQSYTLVAAILDLEYAIGVPFGTLGRNK